jgi:hypothetical protein
VRSIQRGTLMTDYVSCPLPAQQAASGARAASKWL